MKFVNCLVAWCSKIWLSIRLWLIYDFYVVIFSFPTYIWLTTYTCSHYSVRHIDPQLQLTNNVLTYNMTNIWLKWLIYYSNHANMSLYGTPLIHVLDQSIDTWIFKQTWIGIETHGMNVTCFLRGPQACTLDCITTKKFHSWHYLNEWALPHVQMR